MRLNVVLTTVFIFVSCFAFSTDAQVRTSPFRLGPGVNFGNMLEAPNEGDWGLFMEERFFVRAKEAGFEHIRLPISWTFHAAQTAPYTIDETFFQRVDWAINQALSRDLKIIINDHHHGELNDDPIAEEERALAIWEQISLRYQNQPKRKVIFEILNEPHGVFNTQPQLWDAYAKKALAKIRESNRGRQVIVGPVYWNSADLIPSYVPPRDGNVIVSFHFYAPFSFTHQGATWIDPVPPVGEIWTGDRYCIRGPWQDWSWNTEVEKSDDGLVVDYETGWAGFRLKNPNADVEGATQLRFKCDTAIALTVTCENDQQSGTENIQTDGTNQTYTVDLGFLGSDGKINDVLFQNASPDDLQPVIFSDIELVTADGIYQLTETENGMITRVFGEIRNWAKFKPYNIYLGEFGAYEPGEYASRVRYTRAVREAAEANKFSWAYWELAAGFGIFDPENDEWRPELRDALIPYLGNRR